MAGALTRSRSVCKSFVSRVKARESQCRAPVTALVHHYWVAKLNWKIESKISLLFRRLCRYLETIELGSDLLWFAQGTLTTIALNTFSF